MYKALKKNMKQLNKEQQQQAIELISDLAENEPNDYIALAKAFLQSLKPKIYICQIRQANTIFFFSKSILNQDFVIDESYAHIFNSIEEARIGLNDISKFDDFKYFILTE